MVTVSWRPGELSATGVVETRETVGHVEVKCHDTANRVGHVLHQFKLQCVVHRASDRLKEEGLVLHRVLAPEGARITKAAIRDRLVATDTRRIVGYAKPKPGIVC